MTRSYATESAGLYLIADQGAHQHDGRGSRPGGQRGGWGGTVMEVNDGA